MLNRLMFCYFIQKKGFLDNNFNYLKDKLNYCKNNVGNDKFYSFYKKFLLVLFHEGLGSNTRNEELKKLLGNIPYLNGGLFDEHEIERLFSNIDIKDEAFERIFTFFDQYDWHLDTRPNTNGREINPDVIGYIFEKYINDRAEMGAYYTKEDITEYISKNCIIPFLFEKTKKAYPNAFRPDGEIWQMLKESEDRYIYDAVKKGVNLPLPDEIAIGINPELENKLVTLDESPKLLELRKDWNKPTPKEYGLPTEIWRETIDRRNRYFEILQKIRNGEITDINDFITYNLNIRQFAQDVIENSNDPELIKELYKCIYQITVLDPTCGSGAFLFAALIVLEPLYEALIFRMKSFVDEAKKGKYLFFESVLHNVNNQPNLKYFIYKSIIINNLYGVDIMKEATEIAKLRLFLKLVSVIDKDNTKINMGLVPLPDIDFNIRSGNTLIGYVSEEEIIESIEKVIDFNNDLEKITEKCERVKKAFSRFKNLQIENEQDTVDLRSQKILLNEDLKNLNESLNELLHDRYYSYVKFEDWEKTHLPFHWFSQFYEIMHDKKGFDVVIGNPPYVEYSNVSGQYSLKKYRTEKCGNLFSFVMEKAFLLTKQNGFIGFIVPISLPSTPRMFQLRKIISNNSSTVFCANFADRPGNLFSGVHQKVSVCLMRNEMNSTLRRLFSTQFLHWYSSENNNERINLLQNLSFLQQELRSEEWLKIGNTLAYDIYKKILMNNPISTILLQRSEFCCYLNMRLMYWAKCFITPKDSKEYKLFYFSNQSQRNIFMSIMNSSTFFMFWEALSDCWHLTNREISKFGINKDLLNDNKLVTLAYSLELDLENKKKYVGTKQTAYEYYHKLSKELIDNIDNLLSYYYNFSQAELDFIISYAVKYRMGKDFNMD